MKCTELIDELKAMAAHKVDEAHTCDTVKSGNPDTEVTKVAVSMFATPEIVKEASAFGAELLIVHEPSYYNHFDSDKNDSVPASLKEKLIKESGITVFRFENFGQSVGHKSFARPPMSRPLLLWLMITFIIPYFSGKVKRKERPRRKNERNALSFLCAVSTIHDFFFVVFARCFFGHI